MNKHPELELEFRCQFCKTTCDDSLTLKNNTESQQEFIVCRNCYNELRGDE